MGASDPRLQTTSVHACAGVLQRCRDKAAHTGPSGRGLARTEMSLSQLSGWKSDIRAGLLPEDSRRSFRASPSSLRLVAASLQSRSLSLHSGSMSECPLSIRTQSHWVKGHPTPGRPRLYPFHRQGPDPTRGHIRRWQASELQQVNPGGTLNTERGGKPSESQAPRSC